MASPEFLTEDDFDSSSEFLTEDDFNTPDDTQYQQRLQEAAQADDPFWIDALNFAKGTLKTGYGQALSSIGGAKKYAGYDTDLLDQGRQYIEDGTIEATRGAGEFAGKYALPVATSIGKNLGLASAGGAGGFVTGGPVGAATGAVALPTVYYFAENFGNELGQSAEAGNTWQESTPMERAATVGGAGLNAGVQAALERLPIKKGLEFVGPLSKRMLATAGKEAGTEILQKVADDSMDKMGFALMGNDEALANTPEMFSTDYLGELGVVGAQGAAGGAGMAGGFHPFVNSNQKAGVTRINADAVFENGTLDNTPINEPLRLEAPKPIIEMPGTLGIEGPQVFESETQPEAGRLYAEMMAQQQELSALDGPPLSEVMKPAPSVIYGEGPQGFASNDFRTPIAQQTVQDIANNTLPQFSDSPQQNPLENFRGLINFNEQLPSAEEIDSQNRITENALNLAAIQSQIAAQKETLDQVIPQQALGSAIKKTAEISSLTPEQQKAQAFSTIMKSRKAADNIRLSPEEIQAATPTELKQVAIEAQAETEEAKVTEKALPKPVKVKQKTKISKAPVTASESIETKPEVNQILADLHTEATQQLFDFDTLNEENARAEEKVTGKKVKRKPLLTNDGVLRPQVFNDAFSSIGRSAKAMSDYLRDSTNTLFFDDLVAKDIPEGERWLRGYAGTKEVPVGSWTVSNARKAMSFMRTLGQKIPVMNDAYKIISDSQGDRHEYVSNFKEIIRPLYRLSKVEQMGVQKFASEVQRPRFDTSGKKIKPDLSNKSLREAGLNERQIIAYRAGRKAFDYSLDNMLRPYLKDVWRKKMLAQMKEGFDGQVPQEIDTAINTIVNNVKLENYWPSSRFGSRYVLTTDADGNTDTLYFVDSTIEAKRKERELLRAGVKGDIRTGVTKTDIKNGEDSFLPLEFLEKLGNIVQDDGGTKDVANLLLEEFIPNDGFLAHVKHKRFVPGYDLDASKVVSDYILGLSSTVSKSTAHHKINQLLNSHPDLQHPKIGGEDNQTRKALETYSKFALEDSVPGKSFRTAQSVYFLGGVAKTALVNSTSNFTSLWPKAHALMGNDAEGIVGKLGREVKNEYVVDSIIAKSVKEEILWKVNNKKLDPQLRSAIKKAVDRGEINFGVNEEISKRANSLEREYGLQDWLMLPNNLVEEHNRLLSFITGFNIATKKGQGFEQAYETAISFNKDVNHDYSKANQPNVVRNAYGANAMLFKQYAGNIVRQMRNELGEKQYGAFARRMGAITLTGGVKAWPFAQMFFLLLTKLGGDPEKKTQNGIKSILGTDDPSYAQTVLYGLPQGLGWFNLSGSLASNELGAITEQTTMGALGQIVAGPAGGIIGRAERALSVMDSDPEKALTEISPEFIRSIRVGNRAEKDGAFTTITGNTVVENPTSGEILKRKLGLQPSRLTLARQDTQEMNALIKERDGVENRRASAKEFIANEFVYGDKEAAKAKMKEVLAQDAKISDPAKKFFNDDKDLNNFLTGIAQAAIRKKLGGKYAQVSGASSAIKPELLRAAMQQNAEKELMNKSPLNVLGMDYRGTR